MRHSWRQCLMLMSRCLRLQASFPNEYFSRVFVLLLATALVNPGSAEAQDSEQSAVKRERLSPGQVLRGKLTSASDLLIDLDLQQGAYLLSVEQLGVDVQVYVLGSADVLYDIPTGRDEVEKVLFEHDSPASRSVRLSTKEYTGAEGMYSVGIRLVTDPLEIEAYGLMTSASSRMHMPYPDDPDADEESGLPRHTMESLAQLEQAFALWELSGNLREQARTRLIAAGLSYWDAWKWTEAADLAANAAFLYQQLGNSELHANALALEAASLIEAASEAHSSGDEQAMDGADDIYSAAIAKFEQAKELQLTNGQYYDYAQTLNNIGLTYHYQALWPEAISYYEEAVEVLRDLNEWSAEMNPLANLAVIDQDRGEFLRAIATQERLLQIMPNGRELAWRADTLDNLAKAKLVLGRSSEALSNFLEALGLHRQIQDMKGAGLSMSGLGSTYRLIGEIDLARQYFEESLPLRQGANDGAGQMSVYRSLADLDLSAGHYLSAMENLSRASTFARSPLVTSGLDVMKAQAWIGMREFDRAAQALERARLVADDIGATRDSADAYYWTGRLELARGNSLEAERWLELSRGMYGAIEVRSGEGQALLDLAESKLARNELHQSIELASTAIEKIEGLRSEITNPQLKAVYLGTRAEYYDVLVRANMMLSDSATTEGEREKYVSAALSVSERAKARSTVDLLSEASFHALKSLDKSTAERLSVLRQQLAEKEYQRNLLDEGGGPSDELSAVLTEILKTRTELDQLESSVWNSNLQYAAVTNPRILQPSEMQGSLGHEELLLQFWLGIDESYLWAVSRDQIKAVTLAGKDRIESLAREIYAHISSPSLSRQGSESRDQKLEQLAEIILTPVAGEISASKNIAVVSDGALHYLPLGILPFEDGQPLAATHALVSVPSMTAVTIQRRLGADQARPEMTLAVVGDPVFENSDSRFQNEMISDGSQNGLPRREYARLPFSGMEIAAIAGLVSPENRLVATDFDATIEKVEGDQLNNYRFVHFATHGIVNSAQPAISSLAFSTRDRSGKNRQGEFRLGDVYSMELNADVVVLSACDTALGREIRGEGLMGLTQGFLFAGAEKVVASLWQVPDRATSELMIRFYTNLLELNQAPVEALRNAQIDIAGDRRWQDPYYWGGFVLVGDWS